MAAPMDMDYPMAESDDENGLIIGNSEQESIKKSSINISEKVIELLNQTSGQIKESQKIYNLKQVQELIVSKDPSLLDNFVDEVLAYQQDKSPELRKFVASFIQEACKKDNQLLCSILGNLSILLHDVNVDVKKQAMRSHSQLFKSCLNWLCKKKTITTEEEGTWILVKSMQDEICHMITSENDGVRTAAIKFMESIIIALSKQTSESEIPKKVDVDFNLSKIIDDHPLFKLTELVSECRLVLQCLLQFICSPNITNVNLMAGIGTLTNIAKQRPINIPAVVQTFQFIHANFPPSLTRLQVSSVRKYSKTQMLILLRHPWCYEFQGQLSTLLAALGASQTEISKNLPKKPENYKRTRSVETTTTATEIPLKRTKPDKPETGEAQESTIADESEDDDDDDDDDERVVATSSSQSAPVDSPSAAVSQPTPTSQILLHPTAVDLTVDDLTPLMEVEKVANLVLLSMMNLPEVMPAHFQAMYTPIAAAGGKEQINHLARLLATQMTSCAIGVGYDKHAEEEEEKQKKADSSQTIQTVLGGHVQTIEEKEQNELEKKKQAVAVAQAQQQQQQSVKASRRIKQFRLADITVNLTTEQLNDMALRAVQRVLRSEKRALSGGVAAERLKLIVGLLSQLEGFVRDEVEAYLVEDIYSRTDLIFAWLFDEYSKSMGYRGEIDDEKPTLATYDACFTGLVDLVLKNFDPKDGLLQKILTEAPLITDSTLDSIRVYCLDQGKAHVIVDIISDLVYKRPATQDSVLSLLLGLTSHTDMEVRQKAMTFTKKLYDDDTDLKRTIEDHSLKRLQYLNHPSPPSELLTLVEGEKGASVTTWSEDLTKVCLNIFLHLLPVNHKLIHDLASVYTSAIADVKRTILRSVETPVRGIGMNSSELLNLLENCPKGAETLITRILHILTDKAAPSPQLVCRVRELYISRVSDVRFLIPVISGLEKKEVISALPKLIQLNPDVVKEVFKRLLGGIGQAEGVSAGPLSPAELLIALHNIDMAKVDMKSVMKATGLCFAETSVYTQEVLAVVMQNLMDQSPIPVLLMRTVIQSLALWPRLIGFAMNILQRLIMKQVWKQKKVWEGFIKCCQRTTPQSYQVLLQLPPQQLLNVFQTIPELRQPMLEHIETLSMHQRAHISQGSMDILQTDPLAEKQREEEEMLRAGYTEAPAEVYYNNTDEPTRPPGTAEPLVQSDQQTPISAVVSDSHQHEMPQS